MSNPETFESILRLNKEDRVLLASSLLAKLGVRVSKPD